MDLEKVCDLINELEAKRDEIRNELDELYEIRQEYWEAERREANMEYMRSVI